MEKKFLRLELRQNFPKNNSLEIIPGITCNTFPEGEWLVYRKRKNCTECLVNTERGVYRCTCQDFDD